jgi:hypothetical protein
VIFALLLFAQSLTPVPGYLTPDTIDTGHFGIALTDGRYRAEAPAGCTDFTTYENVTVWLSEDQPNWVILTPLGADAPACTAHVLAKMSDVPCFASVDGSCDVSYEIPDED